MNRWRALGRKMRYSGNTLRWLEIGFGLAIGILPDIARSDTPLSGPYARVVASNSGTSFVLCIPPAIEATHEKAVKVTAGVTIGYRVSTAGAFSEEWRTEKIGALGRACLSNDGLWLVIVNEMPAGAATSKEHIAVSFFRKGELLKSYSTKELVGDSSKVRRTASHYQWLWDERSTRNNGVGGGRIQACFVAESDTFYLTTCIGETFKFDMKSGSILARSR